MKFSTKVKSIRNSIEFSHGVRRALVGALILVYFVSLGFNIVAITTLLAVSTLIMVLFEFPTGAIADYDSRKKSLIISFFLIFISFLGLFLFKNFWILAGFWILNDIAWTFSSGADFAWAIDALGYAKKKSKLVSLVSQGEIFGKSGHVIGGLIGLIVVAINFRFVWLVISLNYLVLFFIALKYMEERNFTPEKNSHNHIKKSFIKAKESFSFLIHKHNKDLRILMFSEFLIVIGLAGFFIGMPLLFTQILNLAPEYLSGIYSLACFVAIGGALIANKVSKKMKFGRSLVLYSFIAGVSMVVFALSNSIFLAILTFVIVKMALGAYDVIFYSIQQHEFDHKIRASLGSLSNILWAVANSIGVFLAGISINFLGIINTLIISGAIAFIAAASFLGMKK